MGFPRRIYLLLAADLFGISLIGSAFTVDYDIRRKVSRSRKHTPFILQHHPDPQSSAVASATDAAPASRRERKNKYKNFSKVEQKDPLEVLIAESGRKNQEIVAELSQAVKKSRPEPEIAPLPKVEFPDTKGIDPYDPQTFGYIEIGSIIGAHGVHGWLKIRCTTDFPQERLCTAGIRHLKASNKRAPRQTVLLQGKHRHLDEYLVQLDQIDSRDSAQKLRGALLYVREEQKDAPEPDQDEYLVSDLVGLDVFLETGGSTGVDDRQFVGNVGGVVFSEDLCSIPGLGHDYLEIVLPRGVGGTTSFRDEMVLIPLVPQIVPRVDIEGRMIYIDPPGGLLDLTYVRQEKTRIKGFLPSAKES
jgi:16S rRNA processing protein RimM